jgi:hypothetical protein
MNVMFGSALLTVAKAQTPDTVVAGPYGVPRLVRTEGGQWSEPVQVFSNTDEIVYVPDITTPGWAQWHTQDFKVRDMYFTYVYTYLRKQRATVQDTLYVNVRTQRATVVRFLKPPIAIDLHTTTPAISKTVAAITKIVQDSIAHYTGPDIQAAARQQRYATGRMFLCNNPDFPPGPDCSLSDADFQKKHPIPTVP